MRMPLSMIAATFCIAGLFGAGAPAGVTATAAVAQCRGTDRTTCRGNNGPGSASQTDRAAQACSRRTNQACRASQSRATDRFGLTVAG